MDGFSGPQLVKLGRPTRAGADLEVALFVGIRVVISAALGVYCLELEHGVDVKVCVCGRRANVELIRSRDAVNAVARQKRVESQAESRAAHR